MRQVFRVFRHLPAITLSLFACSSESGDGGNGGAAGAGGSAGVILCSKLEGTPGACGLHYSSCSDGNTYAVECAGECTCSKNGSNTGTYSPAGACDPDPAKCGFQLQQGCLTASSTWVALGQNCDSNQICCIAQGAVKCASLCGDGGSGGGGGSAGAN